MTTHAESETPTMVAGSHAINNNNNNIAMIPESVSSKKKEFRKYLEESGVIDAFSKVLIGLYEEPERDHVNAMDYVKQYLGAPVAVDWEGLKEENEQLKQRVEQLEKRLAAQRADPAS